MTDPTVPPNVVRCLCAVTAVGRAHGTEPACAEHGTGVVAELARLRGVVQELNAHDLYETLRKYRRLGKQYGIASATIAALRGQLARARWEGPAHNAGEALRWLRGMVATSSRDWALHPSDALLYGVLVGWEEAAVDVLVREHRWTPRAVEQMRSRRAALAALAEPVASLGDLPPRPATGCTMVVCGAECTEPDCHDDGDRWVCTLPPHAGDDHAGIVVGGWHSWTTRGQHETRPTGPGATFDERVTVPRPVEPTVDPYRSTHFRPYR